MGATVKGSQRKQKRKAGDALDSDDEYKKRGRPRVEDSDKSTANRRRTQIRMAQRAYRKRKESTLEDLRNQVSELTNTVELMNAAFSELRGRLSVAITGETQLKALSEASMRYETLMGVVRNMEHHDGPPQTKGKRQRDAPSPKAQDNLPSDVETIARGVNVPSWLDESVLNRLSNQDVTPNSNLGYITSTEIDAGLQQANYSDFYQQLQADIPNQGPAAPLTDFSLLAEQLHGHAHHLQEVRPPITYSFQETSFGRRLHRACLESGYQLVLDPARRSKAIEKAFCFSPVGLDRARLAAALKATLDRGPRESLEILEAPAIHIGGAGTHYPRRDAFGRVHPKKPSYNLGCISPQTLKVLANVAKNNLTVDFTVEVTGYEGDWLDPYDVEWFLEERGIYVDPLSSFAVAEITDSACSVETSTAEASVTSTSTPSDISSMGMPVMGIGAEHLVNNTFQDAGLTNVGYSDALTGSWMNFIRPEEGVQHANADSDPSTWKSMGTEEFMHESTLSGADIPTNIQPSGPNEIIPFSREPHKHSIIVDISKFISTLINTGVCLGRSPGFRRADVEGALDVSSFDAEDPPQI